MAQARVLLTSLHEHVDELTRTISETEHQIRRAKHGSTLRNKHLRIRRMRQDLYEAYRLIDQLHHRFPSIRREKPPARKTPSPCAD
ncbi:hypothetical protein EJ571_15365 [Mycobacteroides franklinii]|uniref:Transposase n=1 Tax=Mycobacteroides franklinii TaxID=948102 RepID=A0A4R5P9I3_9MYCO|nr:hypothetical protein BST24_21665 [Mycobacteroides franklinii]TDH20583.1 hypothetical protein EJ571_15365 [Mycobacteroides franklinii]